MTLGGGAVYVDSGAVNVVLLNPRTMESSEISRERMNQRLKPLHELGATAVEQTGRNDLTIEGKKVSGAAMTISNGRIRWFRLIRRGL